MSSKKIMTIERHILQQQEDFPQASGAFTNLLYDVALAAKFITQVTRRAGLIDILGEAGSRNVYGESQQKLDVYADEIIFKLNDHTGRVCIMASEENEEVIHIPDEFPSGNYALLFDPLDGSSNIDVNVSVGTIFGIFRKVSPGERGSLEDVLQRGRQLIAAGYIVYGSSTMMVYSTGQGVHGFTLEPDVGEFLLSHENIRIPEKPKYYSTNHGYERNWTSGVRKYIKWLQGLDEDDPRTPLTQRYIGALISDFHRNLLKGGVFVYPGDLNNPEKPYGKLRLLFEEQALAFLAEQAGGYASDGLGSILDLQPHYLHQRAPLFIGNRDLVEAAERYIQEHDQEWIDAYLPFRNGVRVPG